MKRIRGFGGGGKGGGGGGSEEPDSLNSTAYARVIDVVSEGEIEGLVNGARSIYLNEVPLANQDGTLNFKGVSVQFRPGTQGQDHVEGFEAVEAASAVGVEVKQTTPVIRSITNVNADAADVIVGVPQLFQIDDSGNIGGTSVEYKIDLQSNGGGFVTKVQRAITGKTSRRYQRAHRIKLEGSPPWDIRVSRITADNANAKLQNLTFFDSISEVIFAKLRYPNTAYIAMSVDSAQFNSIPTRAYDLKLLRIRIPTNYDPILRTYTGSWDGNFQIAWSNNPAWVFYDMVTSDRYGLGQFVDASQVDKWALYTIARYCDEQVPDGYGGFEPRFTCNVYFQTRQEAYNVLQSLASVFRGMSYWSGGAVTASQDAPSDPVHLYTAANVIDGLFTYTGASLKQRHTVALVSWNDLTDFGKLKVEYVPGEDEDIARFGIVQTELVAVGCTSRGQANRVGRWLLFTEKFESEVVAFKTGLEGAVGRPGQIIAIADPARAGTRLGGRILSGTTTSVKLDAPVTLASGVTYTLSVLMDAETVADVTVTSAAGTTDTLSITALPSAPPPMAIWVLASANVQPQLFRVISVSEPERGVYEFAAVAHTPGKYAAIEQGVKLETREISTLRGRPQAPTNVTIAESLYESAGSILTLATISWDSQPLVASYLVRYSVDDSNPVEITTQSNEIEVQAAPAGLYAVEVIAIGISGARSVPGLGYGYIGGNTEPPADLTNFAIAANEGTAFLTWDQSTSIDVRVGGRIVLRYSPKIIGAIWNDGTDLAEFSGVSTSGTAPLLAGTYMLKARDAGGLYSANEVVIVNDVGSSILFNAVEARIEQPEFAGSKFNVYPESGALKLALGAVVDSFPLIDSMPGIDSFGATGPALGIYLFGDIVDLGEVNTSRVTSQIESQSFLLTDLVDAWPEIDGLDSIDGATVSGTSAAMFISTTAVDPALNQWSPWKRFVVGDYRGRAYRFKLELSSDGPTKTIQVSRCEVVVDMPDRIEADDNVTVPTTGLTVEYFDPFRVKPALAVTAQNLATGDYIELTSQTNAGFTVQIKNTAGAGVSRTIDWIAKGYGRAVAGNTGGSGGGTGTPGGPLTASATPTLISGAGETFTVSTVDFCEAVPSGGTPPYTLAWSKLSGDSIQATSPTEIRTRFKGPVPPGTTRTAVFACTVTDSLGANVNTNSVTVELANTSTP